MVLFTVCFICLLFVGNYVCKFVCQFIGCGLCFLLGLSVCWLWGYVWYWVSLYVGWWLCDNIISFNSRDGVSVGLFYYRFKTNPMDFKLQMSRLLAILGVYLSFFFLCGLLLLCVLPWVICFMFGVVWGFFWFCDKYLY